MLKWLKNMRKIKFIEKLYLRKVYRKFGYDYLMKSINLMNDIEGKYLFKNYVIELNSKKRGKC